MEFNDYFFLFVHLHSTKTFIVKTKYFNQI